MYDVIIIGAGPAGLTAATYALRANLKIAVFYNELVGGKIWKTLLIENFPSFSTGSGAELARQFQEQAKYQKIPFIQEEVQKIDLPDWSNKTTPFTLTTTKNRYQSRFLIMAMGTKERKLPISGAAKFDGRGLSYCASCDGAFYRDQPIAVIGGGNSALEETKMLTNICSKIYMINRDSAFSGQQILVDYVTNHPKIEIFSKTVVKKFIGEKNLEKIEIVNQQGKTKTLVVNGLFAFIGSLPNNELIGSEWGLLNEKGYIQTNNKFQTKIPQLYAIGDIVANNLQQYTTAMGSATIAITEIIKQF